MTHQEIISELSSVNLSTSSAVSPSDGTGKAKNNSDMG